MDPIMDVIKNSEEPEWLERPIIGELRVWQFIFLCLAGITSIIVMVCCCFRFRIPRTKQQIEADYKRRKITTKFRQQLETIQDSKMDSISLKDGDSYSVEYLKYYWALFIDLSRRYMQVFSLQLLYCTLALELLHEKSHSMEEENQQGSQPSSIMSPQQSSLDASFQPEGTQKPETQASGLNFVKFATKVANISKLSQTKSPTSPTTSDNKMEF